jgi:hypothetical protein
LTEPCARALKGDRIAVFNSEQSLGFNSEQSLGFNSEQSLGFGPLRPPAVAARLPAPLCLQFRVL